MSTPLYDALMARADRGTARFHMPGHKGVPVTPALSDPVRLDFTELPDTGNLYVGDDVIEGAEDLWAKAWGFDCCQFLTGGSTLGLHAALLLCARRGRDILVDRASHQAVWNGMGLWDMLPHSLLRRQTEPVGPKQVEAALRAHPEVKTVCITSPTYYGVLSDVQAISEVCHAHGCLLLVDGAHGAHLPFLGLDVFKGADLVVTSAHKTLPVLGQGALLFGRGFSPADLRQGAAVTGTTSPSYPVMASMDCAREWMEGAGLDRYRGAADFVEKCRKKFSALTGPDLDPCRLTLVTGDGFGAAETLEALGVVPEMADAGHVVFIVTGADPAESWDRLWDALGKTIPDDGGRREESPLPPAPERALTPRGALLARREEMPLNKAEGRAAAQAVAPYPPGVPVLAPGEVITKKALAYLEEVGYNMERMVAVCVP